MEGEFARTCFDRFTMAYGFIELRDVASLDDFLARSNGDPAIIFKHSDTCGISARAYTQMSQLERPVGLVTVQTARAVSDELEKRLGLAHETPQVMIVTDGKVSWTASHGQVKAAAVETALAKQSAKGKERSEDGASPTVREGSDRQAHNG